MPKFVCTHSVQKYHSMKEEEGEHHWENTLQLHFRFSMCNLSWYHLPNHTHTKGFCTLLLFILKLFLFSNGTV